MENRNGKREAVAWAILLWTFAVTLLRTLRWPNDFALAHWLLDYRFGFIRRALVGSVCALAARVFPFAMTPRGIAGLSLVALCGMAAALLYAFHRMWARAAQRETVWALGVLFASSPFVVMSGHLLGYLDAFLYVFTVAAVRSVLGRRPFLASFFSALGLLCHESYAVVGLPLVGLASAAVVTAGGGRAQWRSHLAALGLALGVLLALPVLQRLTTDPAVLRDQLREHLGSFGFGASRIDWVAQWEATPLKDILLWQYPAFDLRLLRADVLAFTVPPLMALLVFVHGRFGLRAYSPFSLLLVAAVSAPLAMHAVAWDTERIATYTLAGAFLAAWILSETRPAQTRDDAFLLVAGPALVLNIFLRISLMDGEVERFDNALRALLYAPAVALFAVALARNLRTEAVRPDARSDPAAP